jgi:hypothetical protein
MEVNHSPPTHALSHTAQHDAIVFACGRFFRSRLFYDYFLLSVARGAGKKKKSFFSMLSAMNFHDNLFLITSNQS